ncbi:hypothetical protein, partial [Stenotrophomonas daejeonensis]|uniref:hypothetical protein n=1 Tax=Stenotrophomonas daejeonensis TaxID=659018 RepID=UPI001B806E4B
EFVLIRFPESCEAVPVGTRAAVAGFVIHPDLTLGAAPFALPCVFPLMGRRLDTCFVYPCNQ